VGLVEEGINGGLIAFKQYLTYGFFNGHCQVEGGEIIKIESVFGHVEHVFSRW